MPASAFRVQGWEDGPLVVFARIRGHGGSYITQASLSGITCTVFNYGAGYTSVATPSVSVSSVVFDTVQTATDDPRWTADSTGFNFRHTVPASAFTASGQYRIEYVFDPVSGDDFVLVVDADILSIYSS